MDPQIQAAFGSPPPDVDLSTSTTVHDNTVIIVLAVVAGLSLASRLLSRYIKSEKLWWDDLLICVSYALLIANVATGIVAGSHGSGHHVWTVNIADVENVIKVLFGYTQIYGADTCFIKLSLLCFIRIFHVGSWKDLCRRKDYLTGNVIAGGIVSICYPIIICTTDFAICRPVSYMWDRYTDPSSGHCDDINLYYILMGMVTMITDLYILIIPVYLVQKLQMPTSRKIMLSCMFGLGFFVCIASAMRIYYLKIFGTHPDVSLNTGPIFVWSAVEPSISIVTANLILSMPAIHRFWDIITGCRPSFGSSHDRSTRGATELRGRSRSNLHGEPSCLSTTIKHMESDEIILLTMDEEQRVGSVISHGKNDVLVTKQISTTSDLV